MFEADLCIRFFYVKMREQGITALEPSALQQVDANHPFFIRRVGQLARKVELTKKFVQKNLE